MHVRPIIRERGLVLLKEDLTPRWIPLMKQAGLNTLGVHAVPTNGSEKSTEELLEWLEQKVSQELLSAFEDAGITVEFEIHVLPWLLKRSLFEEHPDWIRTDAKGERDTRLNFCTSSQEAMDIVCKRTVELAEKLRQKSHRYYFWLDDAPNAFCCCEKCRSYSPSDQSVLILNRMLEALRTYDPEATLAYLAYKDTLKAPTIRPDPGLFLEFAPIDRLMTQSLTAQEDTEKYTAVADLDKLLTIFDRRTAQVLDYWMDDSLFSKWKRPAVELPFDAEVMAEDVRLYVSRGLTMIKSFGAYMDADYFRKYGIPPVKEYGSILMAAERRTAE